MKNINYVLIACLFFAGCLAVKPTERIEFMAADLYPEGIVYDKGTNVYYVSSARQGTVGRVTGFGVYTPLYNDSIPRSTYGMKIHPDGKRLFVCISDANYSKFSTPETKDKLARLIALDVATGKKLMDVDLSGLIPDKHFVNDIAFDDKGNTYVTDSYADAIYKVTAGGQASVFSQSPLFKTEGIGLNGIVYHPGGYLLASATGLGVLFKVDANNPQNVQEVKSDMFFIGADGMLLDNDSTVTLVVNGGNDKIFKLQSSDSWASLKMAATTLIMDRFTYPSTATFANGDVWVMNARFNELNDSNAIPSKAFAIQKAVFKPIPKKFRKEM